jgi:hypothetical protein
MQGFLSGVSVVAMSLIFIGGAAVAESVVVGLLLAGVGGGSLGVLYGFLIRLSSSGSGTGHA